MPNKILVEFIKESRKRGFDDFQIREPLLKHGWPLDQIEEAFLSLKPKYKFKNRVTLELDNEILHLIEKRAKKNMFTISEQIEDILRRSCLNQINKKVAYDSKLDDTLVSIFSRAKRGKRE